MKKDDLLSKIISLIDLTSLNEDDTEDRIVSLLQKAVTLKGSVAAVCVLPRFVSFVKNHLKSTSISVATVVNFPSGNESADIILRSIDAALRAGANEIDMVFPYEQYLSGKKEEALQLVSLCKVHCKDAMLKVILETSAWKDEKVLHEASRAVLQAGADFLKTSTGKTEKGATLEAARVMLSAIQKCRLELNRPLGLKISGGLRTVAQVIPYLELAETMMGVSWIHPDHFRIGTSGGEFVSPQI